MPSSSVERNISLLQSSDANVRFEAVKALGRLMNRTAVLPLVTLLKSEAELEIRRAIVFSLSLLGGNEALSVLLEILQADPDLETRRNAAGGLRFFANKISSTELVEIFLNEPEAPIREVLASTLIFLKDVSIIAPLLSKFKESSTDNHLQECCLEILGSFEDPRTEELLVSCISSENREEIRHIATRAMGKKDEVKFIPQLYEIYKNDPSKAIRDCAFKILDELSITLNFSSVDQMVLVFLRQQERQQDKAKKPVEKSEE